MAGNVQPCATVRCQDTGILGIIPGCLAYAAGPSHQVRVSQQEIMSPPKEDTPVLRSTQPGSMPGHSTLPSHQAILPEHEPPQGATRPALSKPAYKEPYLACHRHINWMGLGTGGALLAWASCISLFWAQSRMLVAGYRMRCTGMALKS